jgi:hypothetical protein
MSYQSATGDHVAANDGLNAALSGSKAADLPNQVRGEFNPVLNSGMMPDHGLFLDFPMTRLPSSVLERT